MKTISQAGRAGKGRFMPLTLLRPGEKATIRTIAGKDDIGCRLRTMGLVEGTATELIASDRNIMLVKVGECRLALDKGMASRVIVAL